MSINVFAAGLADLWKQAKHLDGELLRGTANKERDEADLDCLQQTILLMEAAIKFSKPHSAKDWLVFSAVVRSEFECRFSELPTTALDDAIACFEESAGTTLTKMRLRDYVPKRARSEGEGPRCSVRRLVV